MARKYRTEAHGRETEPRAWFAAKRYGYGADLPIAWQGWVVMLVYVALLAGAAFLLLPGQIVLFAAVAVAATVLFLFVVARRTRGGWRWRWGGDEGASMPRRHLVALVALISFSLLLAVAGLILLASTG